MGINYMHVPEHQARQWRAKPDYFERMALKRKVRLRKRAVKNVARYGKKMSRYGSRSRAPVEKDKEGGWTKHWGVSTNLSVDPVFKLLLYGTAALAAIYLIMPSAWAKLKLGWCKLTGGTNCDETMYKCPEGYHSVDKCDNLTGLPKIACDTWMFTTGGLFGCVADNAVEDCKLRAVDCWSTHGQYSQVDLKTCECTHPKQDCPPYNIAFCDLIGKPIDPVSCACVSGPGPGQNCDPSYIELASCKLQGLDYDYQNCACESQERDTVEKCIARGGTWDMYAWRCIE